MTTFDEFINNDLKDLNEVSDKPITPNEDFTIEESVNWYFNHAPDGFWKDKKFDGKTLDYKSLLEIIDGHYTKEGFDTGFQECMELNFKEGKNFMDSIIDTMQNFEQALTIGYMVEKMSQSIAESLMKSILSDDSDGLDTLNSLFKQ